MGITNPLLGNWCVAFSRAMYPHLVFPAPAQAFKGSLQEQPFRFHIIDRPWMRQRPIKTKLAASWKDGHIGLRRAKFALVSVRQRLNPFGSVTIPDLLDCRYHPPWGGETKYSEKDWCPESRKFRPHEAQPGERVGGVGVNGEGHRHVWIDDGLWAEDATTRFSKERARHNQIFPVYWPLPHTAFAYAASESVNGRNVNSPANLLRLCTCPLILYQHRSPSYRKVVGRTLLRSFNYLTAQHKQAPSIVAYSGKLKSWTVGIFSWLGSPLIDFRLFQAWSFGTDVYLFHDCFWSCHDRIIFGFFTSEQQLFYLGSSPRKQQPISWF